MDFCETYAPHFIGQGMHSVGHARHYLSGLLGTQRRKNIETIENDVAGSDYQGMEQFVSSSPWCHKELMDHVALDANRLLGDARKAGLYIDESSFLKKGRASVGVQRQWSGRAGKVENCQVGVFACLGNEERMCITDFRLYLPESWAEDDDRCRKAKIPDRHRIYQAKWQQALEMVTHAREQGLEFGWVGVDSLYGSNAKFLNAVEDLGEKFMRDVNRTTKVWCSKPRLEEVPSAQGNGRPRKHARLSADNRAEYASVGELTSRHFESKHQVVSYRRGHKGKLSTRVWVRKVWRWEKGWDRIRHRLLVVRQDADGSFKYSLTNLPSDRDWAEYAWIQGQRFWIEHAFHEAKSQLGMAQYQVRVWRGWHHHMSLVCLALLFTMKTRDELMECAPLLTTRDITELLDFYLPRRSRVEEEVLARIHHRHRKRKADIERGWNERTGLPP
ncbi:MAG: IS701 family transposase [Verrucomicrobiae bacterium]|nr:IS701 family transposase [Verrucomicrobiae bacterium]